MFTPGEIIVGIPKLPHFHGLDDTIPLLPVTGSKVSEQDR